jgi:hypothetical protein
VVSGRDFHCLGNWGMFGFLRSGAGDASRREASIAHRRRLNRNARARG